MDNFASLGLPQSLMHALDRMNFNTPTPIQAQAIPPALEGHDILGSAQTGTGKTGAFGIPLVAHLLANPESTALVMTPTRELAVQVTQMMQQLLGNKSPIKHALLIGGESINRQFMKLRANPRLIVGTPGRINDHLMRKTVKLDRTDFLVLDETDRMLDMGFSIQIEKILAHMPQERQTLLFSATLPQNIVRISERYLNDPVRVSVGSTTTPAPKIKQEIVHASEAEKYTLLLDQLTAREGSIIVFVKTKWGAEKMAQRLHGQDHNAAAIHGDLRHNQRERVITAFRNKKTRILVATDIAARGLDIPHIEHVINFDLPQCPEDYIHRIGRTARAGAEGSALCFVSPSDKAKWYAINRLLNPEAKMERPPHSNSGKPKKKKFSAKPFDAKKQRRDGKPAFGKASFDKPAFDKPAAGKPAAGKPYKGKPAHGDKPANGKPAQGKPANGKPAYGNKPAAGKSFNGKPAHRKGAQGASANGKKFYGKPKKAA